MKKFLSFPLLFLCALSFSQQAQHNHAIAKIIERESKSNRLVPVFVQGDITAIKSVVQELQGVFVHHSGNIAAVQIREKDLTQFIQSKGVLRVESGMSRYIPLNDTMRVNNFIQQIHDGNVPLSQPYKGTGVVYGFIDTGIDYTHPDLQDTTGKTRFAYIWDQTKPAATNTPAPFNYGQEWDKTAIDNGQCTQTANYHGTLVAGIGAANNNGIGHNEGAAPEATLIGVNFDFSNSTNKLADAVAYIYDKANLLGMPCVINASLGDYYGSHDGQDLEAQQIKNYITAQPGRLMTAAIGNKGDDSLHLGYNASSTTRFTWFKFDPNLNSFIPGLGYYIQVWGDTADFKNINFNIGMDESKDYYSYKGNTPDFNVLNSLLLNKYDTLKNGAGQRLAIINRYSFIQGGVYSLEYYIFPDSSNYLVRLNSSGSGHLDLWNIIFSGNPYYPSGMVIRDLPSVAINPDIANYEMPDNDQNMVSSFACLDEVATAGNYFNRKDHIDCALNPQSLIAEQRGSIVPNSSTGPTRDGRQKPDVAASGSYNMSCIPVAFWPQLPTIKQSLDGCKHWASGGSSFAAPVIGGTGALFLELYPTLIPADFIKCLRSNTYSDTFTGSNLPNNKWGSGKLNSFATLTNCSVTSINDTEINDLLLVAPNPATVVLTVTLYVSSGSTPQLSVYSIDGMLQYTTSLATANGKIVHSLDCKNFSAGLYMVMVNNGGKISYSKFVKE
ncbi:MAG: S8 family peptidase [Bacteroidetes bacterium]|nr:S8 family peptidase [Bacteroidota bacterium]